MSRRSSSVEALRADLTASEVVVRIRRRRRTPEKPWRYRAVCARCGELGDGWTASEQAATELGFEHADRHARGEQLALFVDRRGQR